MNSPAWRSMGRLTDIERWIERHAQEAAHAPFVAPAA
jgi:hypothetical protein